MFRPPSSALVALVSLASGILSNMSFVRAAPADAVIPSAASFYVPTLPDLQQDQAHPLRIWAGHLSSDPNVTNVPATEVTPHLYFVLTKARRTSDKERVIFWFNGGPGCSSFDGLMMEVGPWRVNGHGGINAKEGGWEEYAHVVYVDQPAGTGFSYTSTNKYVTELTDATAQLVQFMRNFYKVFPEFQNMDTYLAGESYAGQFIPYFADGILNSDLHLPLKGVAIGNGWMDGKTQYPAYYDYGIKHGILEENSEHAKEAKKLVDQCATELGAASDGKDIISTSSCERILYAVLKPREREVNGTAMCANIYDVRLDDTVPACGMNWPPDLKEITPYLGRSDVVAALHATAAPVSWTECRGRVHQSLTNQKSPSAVTLMPKVLERIPMLFFAGDQDFICNYMGVEAMIRSMEWNGGKGFGTVQTQGWSVNGTAAGTWVESRNLTYVKIFNASHMVGFDLPHVAHDMMLRFMGVDFSFLTNGSASIPSAVGDNKKPMLTVDGAPVGDGGSAPVTPAVPPGKTPEQDKAMWEAYYNAGSAALVLVLVLVAIGTVLWCRSRRRSRGGANQLPGVDEESVPLSAAAGFGIGRGLNASENGIGAMGNGGTRMREARERRGREGERLLGGEEDTVFEVGESEDERSDRGH